MKKKGNQIPKAEKKKTRTRKKRLTFENKLYTIVREKIYFKKITEIFLRHFHYKLIKI